MPGDAAGSRELCLPRGVRTPLSRLAVCHHAPHTYPPTRSVRLAAAVVWEMCTHEKPFGAMTYEAFKAALEKGVRPEVPSEWPASLRELLADCWEGSPADRIDARDVRARLSVVREDAAAMAPAEAPKEKSQACTLL